MSNYLEYRDANKIKLGDDAFEKGDFKLSIKLYSQALEKLREYQGDKWIILSEASNLVAKINMAKSRL